MGVDKGPSAPAGQFTAARGLTAVVFLLIAGCCGRVEKAAQENAAAPSGKPKTFAPGVYLINKDFNRSKSRVLIRRVVEPTWARLDLAAYDANPILVDPMEYNPKPPAEPVPLSGLDFGGALVRESLRDRLDQTPLTDQEKAAAVAWLPMLELLIEREDFEKAKGLKEVHDAVVSNRWNDEDVIPYYQEIALAYLHNDGAGRQMWVKIEFKPWVRFLAGVDDEDKDGFPEIYGRVRPEALNDAVLDRVAGDYMKKVLTWSEIREWAFVLGSFWYPSYDTYTLRPEDSEKRRKEGKPEGDDPWPDEEAVAEVGPELAAMPDNRPTVVIRGAPFKIKIYLVLYIERAAEK